MRHEAVVVIECDSCGAQMTADLEVGEREGTWTDCGVSKELARAGWVEEDETGYDLCPECAQANGEEVRGG